MGCAAALRDRYFAPVSPAAPNLPLLLITGDEDKVGPPEATQELADAHGNASVEILSGVEH
jgi:pimeloyl-ACP methyl ester carboxylesterase